MFHDKLIKNLIMNRFRLYIWLLTSILFSVSMTSCFEEEENEEMLEEEYFYEYVDLGLPSGLKWATMNVGATKPEEYGGYYSWGEIEEKEHYSWSNGYKYDVSESSLLAINVVDSCGNLTYSHDAASMNWGGLWRTPTESEFKELINHCDWNWTNLNGVNGYMVSSKEKDNKNSIFLPAGGINVYPELVKLGEFGYYWCANTSDDYSLYSTTFQFNSDMKKLGRISLRYSGQVVRPVAEY